MANKTPIEEQVAQLSQQQQDRIIKIDKIVNAVTLIAGIPWIIYLSLGVWTIINSPLKATDSFYKGFTIACIIALIFIVGVYVITRVIVKNKCPYFSDAKVRYIKKIRKQK